MPPEGQAEGDDDSLPDEQDDDDDDDCPPVADIFRSRTEDLGDNPQVRP